MPDWDTDLTLDTATYVTLAGPSSPRLAESETSEALDHRSEVAEADSTPGVNSITPNR